MRIVLVETAPYGGLLHYAVQLGNALASRGHQVELLTPRDNELTTRAHPATMRDVLIRPVDSTAEPPSGGMRILIRRARIAVRLVRAWMRISWEARRGRFDVVIVNCGVQNWIGALGALGLTSVAQGATRVDICHNAAVYDRWRGKGPLAAAPRLQRLLRSLYRRFDLVLVHGERTKAEFETRWPGARLALVPHGDERVFADEPPPPSDEERILFFGFWNKVKGMSVLMDAFDQLLERRPTARLTIAGSPQAQQMDVEVVRRWALAHRDTVRMVDRYVPIEEVSALFASARVVATPYLVGYQSGVVHIAMTMARAVVASDVGDLSAVVIDGETGIIVPPGDAAALSRALERLLSDPELAGRMGAAGRERVMRTSGWETVADRVEDAIMVARSEIERPA
jgi:glycosyltransferase involved in cell wall biosynthesis